MYTVVMALKTEISLLPPDDNLGMVVARVNDNLKLLLDAIRDVDRKARCACE